MSKRLKCFTPHCITGEFIEQKEDISEQKEDISAQKEDISAQKLFDKRTGANSFCFVSFSTQPSAQAWQTIPMLPSGRRQRGNAASTLLLDVAYSTCPKNHNFFVVLQVEK